jgi:hypothetical protein
VRAVFSFCPAAPEKVVIDAQSGTSKPRTSHDHVAGVLAMLDDSISKVKSRCGDNSDTSRRRVAKETKYPHRGIHRLAEGEVCYI